MNSTTSWLDQFIFGYYPYICFTVFLLGSWIRFDREQYTWSSDSSQLLRTGSLRWGSNLFHIGVLIIFFGHLIGMLAPHWAYEWLMSAGNKQVLAMTVGGIAGVMAFIGVTLLLIRRLGDDRIRKNSKTSDIVLLLIFWIQLVLGLGTIYYSSHHLDGSVMLKLSEWAQSIVTFRSGAAQLLDGVDWIFKTHMFLGMTIFLIFPFTRLVHIWSGLASIAYLFRPYQVVRGRKLGVGK